MELNIKYLATQLNSAPQPAQNIGPEVEKSEEEENLDKKKSGKKKIIQKMFESNTGSGNYNLKEWFDFASSFWEFTSSFEGVT